MSLLEAILLGALQGATEFLPISSSGHLALAQHFLGIEEADVAFDVALHVATLLAVLVVYRRSLARLLGAGLRGIGGGRWLRAPKAAWRESEEARWLVFLALGSVPTAILGLLFQEPLERAFSAPRLVATMLLVTGAVLLLPRLRRRPGSDDVSWWKAPLVGIAQGLAITPGISRSGSTISLALLMGVEAEKAARFSFLLSIPAIAGALALKAGDLAASNVTPAAFVAGFVSAFVIGLAALVGLLALLKRGRFAVFSVYCFALGLAALIALG